MDLGKVIKSIRISKRIGQSELATECGITQSYLSLIENNQKNPNYQTLEKIALQLHVPLAVITYLAMEKSDVPKKKLQAYENLDETVRHLIKSVFIPEISNL